MRSRRKSITKLRVSERQASRRPVRLRQCPSNPRRERAGRVGDVWEAAGWRREDRAPTHLAPAFAALPQAFGAGSLPQAPLPTARVLPSPHAPPCTRTAGSGRSRPPWPRARGGLSDPLPYSARCERRPLREPRQRRKDAAEAARNLLPSASGSRAGSAGGACLWRVCGVSEDF